MKRQTFFIGAVFTAVLALTTTGCSVQPQQPINLSNNFWQAPNKSVGIVMAPLPTIDTYEIGADCLLCLATVAAANSSLTAHVTTLSDDNLPALKNDLAKKLEARGITSKVIDEPFDIKALTDSSSTAPNAAKKDYSSFKAKYHVNQLLVVQVNVLGTFRTYASYVPTSDPKGAFNGVAYMVNLDDNTYSWYMPIDIQQSAGTTWDEPPKFPGITNAYYQALATGKDTIIKAFTP